MPRAVPVSSNRDLKHQDGRWRRGRHIRVKAEARPASRFTRLSMLSNIPYLNKDDFDFDLGNFPLVVRKDTTSRIP